MRLEQKQSVFFMTNWPELFYKVFVFGSKGLFDELNVQSHLVHCFIPNRTGSGFIQGHDQGINPKEISFIFV